MRAVLPCYRLSLRHLFLVPMLSKEMITVHVIATSMVVQRSQGGKGVFLAILLDLIYTVFITRAVSLCSPAMYLAAFRQCTCDN
jgi:hypothetical protein